MYNVRSQNTYTDQHICDIDDAFFYPRCEVSASTTHNYRLCVSCLSFRFYNMEYNDNDNKDSCPFCLKL